MVYTYINETKQTAHRARHERMVIMTMTVQMKEIIREMVDDLIMFSVKRIDARNLEVIGDKMDCGTPHIICNYSVKKYNKVIYFEYDTYRNIARNAFVHDIKPN